MNESYRAWIEQGVQALGPAGRVALIVAGAWVLHRLVRALIGRLGARAILPAELVVGIKRTASSLITVAALLLVLDQFGVSATVLWTAFTGFVAVAAIAFFAAWSVLSNVFCMILLVTTRPFRLYDEIEVLENGDKPGLRGQVIDLNLIYTTLREAPSENGARSVLHVPNSMFFQRVVRRWAPQPERTGTAVQQANPMR
ncbi:MAG TPA: mechanosensitive ion channel family protein [Steroidobacter sp.]